MGELKREFQVQRQGKPYVLYAGLLDLAHQEGLKEIATEIVQLPTDANGNTAVVLARVTTERGVFSEMGDACPTNVNRMMVPHLLRMASTRAKARALRDAVNVGVAALEELGPDASDGSEGGPASAEEIQRAQGRQARPTSVEPPPPKPGKDGSQEEWYRYLAYASRLVKLNVPHRRPGDTDDDLKDLNRQMKNALDEHFAKTASGATRGERGGA